MMILELTVIEMIMIMIMIEIVIMIVAKLIISVMMIIIAVFFHPECIALFDYVGLEGDLSFSEGDVIKITKKESDWWEGVLRNECGFFPANYVKVKEQPEVRQKLCK